MTEPTAAGALTPELAQEIAGEISGITGFNVLITDRNAVVIGSGDRARLGTVHEASAAVIRDLRPVWHTAEQARVLTGVRPGTTLPILLDGVAVGTVGLTGPPRRVRPFGLVVQRQTEILLRQAILLRSRMLHDRALTDLFRDIVLYDPDATDAEALAQRARELGLDPALPRAVLLVDITAPVEPPTRPARAVREEFGPQDVVVEVTAGRIGVLCRLPGRIDSAERTAADHAGRDAELRDRCDRLVGQLHSRHRISARIGIGEPATRLTDLHDSYTDAATALRLAPLLDLDDRRRVFPITELRPHQLLAETNPRARSRYLATTLARLPDEPDWPTLRETLVAWAESGFNLVRAAARLHIHRNTLLYRLNKISARTGRSCRHPPHALTLYLAALTHPLHTG